MVVPTPTAEVISMIPPMPDTIPYTVASPRPVPRPRGLVEKNGSKTRSMVAWSMPLPVSATARRQ